MSWIIICIRSLSQPHAPQAPSTGGLPLPDLNSVGTPKARVVQATPPPVWPAPSSQALRIQKSLRTRVSRPFSAVVSTTKFCYSRVDVQMQPTSPINTKLWWLNNQLRKWWMLFVCECPCAMYQAAVQHSMNRMYTMYRSCGTYA